MPFPTPVCEDGCLIGMWSGRFCGETHSLQSGLYGSPAGHTLELPPCISAGSLTGSISAERFELFDQVSQGTLRLLAVCTPVIRAVLLVELRGTEAHYHSGYAFEYQLGPRCSLECPIVAKETGGDLQPLVATAAVLYYISK